MAADDARETARMLEIAAVQIATTLRESDGAIGEMIDAITSLSAGIRSLQQPGGAGDDCLPGTDIATFCQQAERDMHTAVVAFQFYDRLTQRLSHVRVNLESLARVILSPTREHPALWEQLRQRASSVYSLEQEQQMYNALINGMAPADLPEAGGAGRQDAGNDIELF